MDEWTETLECIAANVFNNAFNRGNTSMDSSNCQQPRFRAAYVAVRELNISKEAFAEGIHLSVSAVAQKISDCSLPSHVHVTEGQANAAEKLLDDLLELKGLPAQRAKVNQPASEAGGNTSANVSAVVKATNTKVKKPAGKPVKVKYLEARDALGRYRFVTPDAEAVGQFDHAETLEEIITKVKQQYAPLVMLEEIWPEDG